LVCNLCRYESASACKSSSRETATADADSGLDCDARLLSLVTEAQELMLPLQFADAAERVVTLAQ